MKTDTSMKARKPHSCKYTTYGNESRQHVAKKMTKAKAKTSQV